MIRFTCPKCGKRFKVPEEHVGKKAKCSECGNVIVVPKVEKKETIIVRCLKCKKEIEVTKKHIGKRLDCPNCGGNIYVKDPNRPILNRGQGNIEDLQVEEPAKKNPHCDKFPENSKKKRALCYKIAVQTNYAGKKLWDLLDKKIPLPVILVILLVVALSLEWPSWSKSWSKFFTPLVPDEVRAQLEGYWTHSDGSGYHKIEFRGYRSNSLWIKDIESRRNIELPFDDHRIIESYEDGVLHLKHYELEQNYDGDFERVPVFSTLQIINENEIAYEGHFYKRDSYRFHPLVEIRND